MGIEEEEGLQLQVEEAWDVVLLDAQGPFDAGLGFLVVRAIVVVRALRREFTDLHGLPAGLGHDGDGPLRTYPRAVGGLWGDAVTAGDQGGLPEDQIGREVA